MSYVTSTSPIEVNIGKMMSSVINQRNKGFGIMIIGALLAFELFNFSTTEFALNDVLGNLAFAGVRWATILSIAFCGIDFAGIARLFTPEQGANEPAEVWYLFGAWILAAAMNATLTWWGVSVAIANHTSQGAAVVSSETIQRVVPIFVAVMVWVIRILIIGTFSLAGERMFGQVDNRPRRSTPPQQQPVQNTARNDYNRPQRPTVPATQMASSRPALAPASSFNPQPKPAQRTENSYSHSAEPTYHNLASNQQAEKYEALSS
ncbi:MAG: hypothetical protein NT121_05735 [Chloroflexi bacterium]|nr:hypothetical protein [Chloroflexota bacterium]